VGRLPDDRFRIFISHKHEDHEAAARITEALEKMCPTIECFVSGSNISAGTDWNREIRSKLAQSHMLILLFTSPTANWDWCLYEAGLFTRFESIDVYSVVCLFRPESNVPRPLANLQGVKVESEAIEQFLEALCRETWKVSDDWRRGPLDPSVSDEVIRATAAEMVEVFPAHGSDDSTHFPCHRIELDLRSVEVGEGIPLDAVVVVGEEFTSTFTLSLFNLGRGTQRWLWKDLLRAVDGLDAAWRHQLDRRFLAAVNEELFSPMTTTIRAADIGHGPPMNYRPVLYRVLRDGTRRGAAGGQPRPIGVTIVLDPQRPPSRIGGPVFNLLRINARFGTEVFDEFIGKVHDLWQDGVDVFADIDEALRLVHDDADRFEVFTDRELRRAYGEDFEAKGVAEMGGRWQQVENDLVAALAARDADLVETTMAQLRVMNRRFALLSAERYVHVLGSLTS
jgi:TIR domain